MHQCSKAGERDSKSCWQGSIPWGHATDRRCWIDSSSLARAGGGRMLSRRSIGVVVRVPVLPCKQALRVRLPTAPPLRVR